MSYSIYYRAMHVQTSKGILPMVECGDNNVWEAGNQRRARSWYNFHASEKSIYSNWNELDDAIGKWNDKYKNEQAKYRTSEEDWKRESADGSFGYFEGIAVYGKRTFNTTFNDFRKLIHSGMKNILSIDEVIKNHLLYIENGWGKEKTLVENEEMLFDALENKKWVSFYEWGANEIYEVKSAVRSFGKTRKGQTPYRITIKTDGNKIQFISMNDKRDQFILVDNIADAMLFTNSSINKCRLFRKFFDFMEMSWEYIN